MIGNEGITAEIVRDSIRAKGSVGADRLLTVAMKAPKWLDAEFEKHRMISSNSSSDRAVPTKRLVSNPNYIPSDIRLNERGMQGYMKLQGPRYVQVTEMLDEAGNLMRDIARQLSDDYNVHKQHVNRYILPWTMQHKLATATLDQWEYFLSLRLNPHADPAIQALAGRIAEVIHTSKPTELSPGEWHLPYITDFEKSLPLFKQQRCSVARAARVSYINHDGSMPDVGKDLELFDRLRRDKHFSCFEHIATPMYERSAYTTVRFDLEKGATHIDRDGNKWSANFKGWLQGRKLFDATT